MSTGIGVGIAGQVFQTKAGAGIAPDPFLDMYSVLFDGVDESLDATVSPNFGTGNFTINFWIYRTSTSGSQNIFYKSGGTGSIWQIFVTNGNAMQWSSTLWPDGAGVGLVPGNDVWEMWTYSVSQTGNTATWYKNAANPNVKPISGLTGDFGVGDTFAIGKNATTSAYNFAGNIDEVSFWNKALSSSEITAIYNSGVPTDLSAEPGLINWFRMGDPQGPSIYPNIVDSVGGINMTMTNMSSANITTNVPT